MSVAIDRAEQELGVHFPALFVAQMRARNGGYVEFAEDGWRLHPFFDTSSKKTATRTADSISRETASFRELAWFPPNGVVIASLDGSCLLLMPEDGGPALGEAVYVWYLDGEGALPAGCDVGDLR